MTREEFIKAKNQLNIPGYSDDDINMMSQIFERSPESMVAECPVCHNFMIDTQICGMCGMEPFQSRFRGEKLQYMHIKSYDPNYIWSVDNNKNYPYWVYHIPQDPVDARDIFVDVFGQEACNLYEEDMERINFMFNNRDVSYKRNFVYSSDVEDLVKNIHDLTGDIEVAKRALLLAATGFYDQITEKLENHMLNDGNDLEKFLDYLESSLDQRQYDPYKGHDKD